MVQQWVSYPLFRLREPALDHGWINSIIEFLEFGNMPAVTLPDGTLRFMRGARRLEVSPDMDVWYEDHDHLWNTRRNPGTLFDPAQAMEAARRLIQRLNLGGGQSGVGWAVAANSGARTASATWASNGAIERGPCRQLDAYVAFQARLEIQNATTEERATVPIVGRGGKAGVVFGDNGRLIGLNASWRPIDGKIADVASLPPAAPFVTKGRRADASSVDVESAQLVYRVVTLPDGVPALCPFWLFATYFRPDGSRRRSSDITTPAADFEIAAAEPPVWGSAPRTTEAKPLIGTGTYSLGVSWRTIGNSDADAEVRAILRHAKSLSWDVRFAWRDDDAWEQDWNADAANWVNAVDLAYYAGHAYDGGLQLTDHRTRHSTILSHEALGELDTTRALLGGNGGKLKWLMVGACGPLQDKCLSGGHMDAFRWGGAFEGLRLLMGFASSIAGFSQEGARSLTLADRGEPLASAWLRAAREGQLSTDLTKGSGAPQRRWAAAMGREAAGGSALDDRLPGDGLANLEGDRTLRVIWAPA